VDITDDGFNAGLAFNGDGISLEAALLSVFESIFTIRGFGIPGVWSLGSGSGMFYCSDVAPKRSYRLNERKERNKSERCSQRRVETRAGRLGRKSPYKMSNLSMRSQLANSHGIHLLYFLEVFHRILAVWPKHILFVLLHITLLLSTHT
jgi:hypothetical protein